MLFEYHHGVGGSASAEFVLVHRGDDLLVYQGGKDDCGTLDDYRIIEKVQLAPGTKVTAHDAAS